MAQLFEVGGKYRNRKGEYEVISMKDLDMVIRYADGTLLDTPIVDQARICRNMQLEEARKQVKKTLSLQTPRKKKVPVNSISIGLVEDDFKKAVAGTCWRRRTDLAGSIAQRISDVSSRLFQSYAIYRRAMVHIAEPRFYNSKPKQHLAKFVFELNPDSARYGFYIERNKGEMDVTWHWPKFISAIETDSELQHAIHSAMERLNLSWCVNAGEKEDLTAEVVVGSDGALTWKSAHPDSAEEISWIDFAERLRALAPNKAYDLFLTTSFPRMPPSPRASSLPDAQPRSVPPCSRSMMPAQGMQLSKRLDFIPRLSPDHYWIWLLIRLFEVHPSVEDPQDKIAQPKTKIRSEYLAAAYPGRKGAIFSMVKNL